MTEYNHIVPWFCTQEWHKVYQDLSDESSSKEVALNLLLVWKARCPSLPSGIESTLTLLQVFVQDAKHSQDVANDQLLRLAYSSAIMRFINHMLDTETVKGSSLYQAAKNLGIPDWIVDLRHNTAHSNNLPPITLLREACTIGLKWLQNNYWDNHKDYIQDYVCGQKEIIAPIDNKIAALINFCISLSICGHSKLKIKNLSEIPNMSMRQSIVNDAKELLGDHIDLSNLKTVSIMAIINTFNTQGKKLLKIKDASSHVNEALLGEDSVFLSRELLYFFSASDFKFKNKLHNSYVQCFEVLLTFIHSNDLMLDFILALIKVTESDQKDHLKARLAALWVSEILIALKKSKDFIVKLNRMTDENTKKKNLKHLYHHWFPGKTGHQLLLDLQKPAPRELLDINYVQPILATYNPYLSYFVKNLLDLIEPSLPSSVLERVCTLAKLISSPEMFPMSSSSVIYTADDLATNKIGDDADDDVVDDDVDDDIEIIETCPTEMSDVNYQDNIEQTHIINGIWKLANKEHNWSTCPIGKVPWYCNESSSVEIETNND